jgi:hypothetical protein
MVIKMLPVLKGGAQMEDNLMVYVATIHCKFDSGIGEYTEKGNLYVGTDYKKAKELLNNYDISDSIYRNAYIECWENGRKICTDIIIV